VSSATAAAIDIGGTKIGAAVVNRHGLIDEVRVIPTDSLNGAATVLRRSIELLQSVVARTAAPAPSVIGIASGGWIERSTGRVVFATDLLPGWGDINLRSEFERAVGLPAVALNDVHAMGISEARLGAGRGRRICVSVAVGTGIGGAITIDGELFEGAHGIAGALGHVQFRAGGARCSCGRHGCIEAYASGPAIAASFAKCAGRRRSSVALPDVVNALASPHEQLRDCARRSTSAAGAALGQVLGGVANTVDPDVIVLGGGAALAIGDLFVDAVRSAATTSALQPSSAPVVTAQLDAAAGVVGAGLAALDAYRAMPEQIRKGT
jgi:glucokinase